MGSQPLYRRKCGLDVGFPGCGDRPFRIAYFGMYAVVAKWTLKPGTIDLVYEIVKTTLEPRFASWPDFRGYYDIKTSETTAIVVILYDREPAPEVLQERLGSARMAIADHVVSAEFLGRGEVVREVQPG